jgi:hypothetical protein
MSAAAHACRARPSLQPAGASFNKDTKSMPGWTASGMVNMKHNIKKKEFALGASSTVHTCVRPQWSAM